MSDEIYLIIESSIGKVDQINASSLLKDFDDWDSMNHIILITRLESEFRIEFTGEEIAGLRTVHDLVDLVSRKIKK